MSTAHDNCVDAGVATTTEVNTAAHCNAAKASAAVEVAKAGIATQAMSTAADASAPPEDVAAEHLLGPSTITGGDVAHAHTLAVGKANGATLGQAGVGQVPKPSVYPAGHPH